MRTRLARMDIRGNPLANSVNQRGHIALINP
jgi:hypothetical protein